MNRDRWSREGSSPRSQQPSAFAGESARATQPRFKEIFYSRQNLRRALRLVDCLAQACAAGDAVGEPGGKLLHLADGVGEFFFNQHLEVGPDHLVAIGLRGLVIECGTGSLTRSGRAKPGWVDAARVQFLATTSTRDLLALAGPTPPPH